MTNLFGEHCLPGIDYESVEERRFLHLNHFVVNYCRFLIESVVFCVSLFLMSTFLSVPLLTALLGSDYITKTVAYIVNPEKG